MYLAEPWATPQGSRPGEPHTSKTEFLNLAGTRITWQASVVASLQRSFWWSQICSDLSNVGKALSLVLRSDYFNVISDWHNTLRAKASVSNKNKSLEVLVQPGVNSLSLHKSLGRWESPFPVSSTPRPHTGSWRSLIPKQNPCTVTPARCSSGYWDTYISTINCPVWIIHCKPRLK